MMVESSAKSICGVILVTNDAERLASFYRDVLDLPVKGEEHGGLPAHYGVDIGATHLGIHPPQSYGRDTATSGGSVVAIEIDNLDARLADLKAKGVEPVMPKHDEGFGPMATIEDTDGNLVELVELRYDFSDDAG